MEVWVTLYNRRPIAAHRTKSAAWDAVHALLADDRARKGPYQWDSVGDSWRATWDHEPPEVAHYYQVVVLSLQ